MGDKVDLGTVGLRIYDIRRRRSPDLRKPLAQRAFAEQLNAKAEELGLTPRFDSSVIARMETGQRVPTIDDATVIASLDPLERGASWLAFGVLGREAAEDVRLHALEAIMLWVELWVARAPAHMREEIRAKLEEEAVRLGTTVNRIVHTMPEGIVDLLSILPIEATQAPVGRRSNPVLDKIPFDPDEEDPEPIPAPPARAQKPAKKAKGAR